MLSKVERNYFLDILLGIIGLVCIITGLIMNFKPQAFLAVFGMIKNLHTWTGCALAFLTFVHVLWHLSWVQAMTNSISKSPRKMWLAVALAVTAVIFCVGIAANAPSGKEKRAPNKILSESMPSITETK